MRRSRSFRNRRAHPTMSPRPSQLLSLLLLVVAGCVAPAARAASTQFTFVGCYEDSQTRRLETFQLVAAAGVLTDDELQSCAGSCTAAGAAFVAVQNANLCYCSAAGFPASAAVASSECAAKACEGGSTSLATGGCGGSFINALYQVADAVNGTCTDGKQGPGEYGVDCGGHCPTPCDEVLDGGFEHLLVLALGASKEITLAQLTAASAWGGTPGVVASTGAPFGNGQLAPQGEYYFGFYAGGVLSQTASSVRPGYTYRLSFQASTIIGDTPTTLVVARDGNAVDELAIIDRFVSYSLDVEVFESSLALSFECKSDTAQQACLLDAVNFTATWECEDVDDQTISAYSGGFFSSCADAVTKTQADQYLCSDDVNDMFPTAHNALAIPDTYCCSACAVAEAISSDVPPSDEFPQCATEGGNCVCTGTIYFGEPGSKDWSEAVSDGTGLECTTDNFGNTAMDAGSGTAACYCGGYTYVGCYDDVVVRPSESFVVGNANDLSSSNVESCITTCRNSGAPYMVLQNADMCFCSYGFPESARLSSESKCASRCGETSLVVYNCGGVFADSLYAISVDPYSCSNGVQDGGEGGVDCGGKCDTPCSLALDGSFETIASTSSSVPVSATTLAAASLWTVSASSYLVRTGASAFGGGQAAPAGQYYFALPGLATLTQEINGTAPGYMLQLRFSAAYGTEDSASSPPSAPTLQVRTMSPVPVDEITLSDTFTEFTADFNIYTSEFPLHLACDTDTAATFCLIDAVSLTVTATCDDALDEAITLYSGSTAKSCESAVRTIEGAGLTCADDSADLFHGSALSVPDNFCCSTCATVEGNQGVPQPSSEYALCAYEGHQCLCDGTVFFGAAGWGDWAMELSDGAAPGLSCDTSVFGDPAEGLAGDKACYCDGDVAYAPSASDYVGCFAAEAEEDFEVFMGAFHNLTLSVCMTMCMQQGHSFFATSFGDQCFCSSGYPTSVTASPASNCAEPCVAAATEICGGQFFLSVYQVGPQAGTCSDGKQDGAEEGVDCGGDCPDKCNLFKDGSFEHLTDTTTKLLMLDPGAWRGAAYIYYNNQGNINKRAVDGLYFAALYGSHPFNQTVSGICNGDILDFSYWAAKVTVSGASSPTLQVVSDDLLWEAEESVLTNSWDQFHLRLIVDQKSGDCCGPDCSITLGFAQTSDTFGAIIDDVQLTVESECENMPDAQVLADTKMNCQDLVEETLRFGQTCETKLATTFPTTLANAGNLTAWDVCCSDCWATATSHVDQAPNNMYQFCANEGGECTCLGTIYFGIDNTYAWSYQESDSATRAVLCTTANFDDPNPTSRDQRKCYCSSHTVTPPTTTTTTTTTKKKTTTRTTTKRATTTTRRVTTRPSAAATTPAPAPAPATDAGTIAIAVTLVVLAVGAAVAVAIFAMRRRKVLSSKGSPSGFGSPSHHSALLSSSLEMELSTVTTGKSSNKKAGAPLVQQEYQSPQRGPQQTKSKRKESHSHRAAHHDSLL